MRLPVNTVYPKKNRTVIFLFLSDWKEMEVAKLSGGCPLLVTTRSCMLDSPSSELQQRLCPKGPFRAVQNISEHSAAGTACPLLGFQQLRLFLKIQSAFPSEARSKYSETLSFQQAPALPSLNHKARRLLLSVFLCTCVPLC